MIIPLILSYMNNEDIIKLNEKRKYYSGLQQSIQPSIKEKELINYADGFISDYIKERSIGNPDIFRFEIKYDFSIRLGKSELFITIDNSKKDFIYQVLLCLKFYLKVKAPLMKALDFIYTHREIPKPARQEILNYKNLLNELDDYLALMSKNSSYDLSEDINVDIIREMEKENHSEDKYQLILIDRWADSKINKMNKDIDEEKLLGNLLDEDKDEEKVLGNLFETLRTPESFLKFLYLCQITIEDYAYHFSKGIFQNVLLTTDLEKKILSPYYDNPELNEYIAELKNNGVDRNVTIDETSNSYQENLNNIVEILNQINNKTELIAQQGVNSEIKQIPADENKNVNADISAESMEVLDDSYKCYQIENAEEVYKNFFKKLQNNKFIDKTTSFESFKVAIGLSRPPKEETFKRIIWCREYKGDANWNSLFNMLRLIGIPTEAIKPNYINKLFVHSKGTLCKPKNIKEKGMYNFKATRSITIKGKELTIHQWLKKFLLDSGFPKEMLKDNLNEDNDPLNRNKKLSPNVNED